jgi:ribosomal protein L30/L7E
LILDADNLRSSFKVRGRISRPYKTDVKVIELGILKINGMIIVFEINNNKTFRNLHQNSFKIYFITHLHASITAYFRLVCLLS